MVDFLFTTTFTNKTKVRKGERPWWFFLRFAQLWAASCRSIMMCPFDDERLMMRYLFRFERIGSAAYLQNGVWKSQRFAELNCFHIPRRRILQRWSFQIHNQSSFISSWVFSTLNMQFILIGLSRLVLNILTSLRKFYVRRKYTIPTWTLLAKCVLIFWGNCTNLLTSKSKCAQTYLMVSVWLIQRRVETGAVNKQCYLRSSLFISC